MRGSLGNAKEGGVVLLENASADMGKVELW